MYERSYIQRIPERPLPSHPLDNFLLFSLIESTVLIYGDGSRFHADEHNHAGRLMKALDKMGREKIEIRAVIRRTTLLDRSSIRALNLYLRHGNGLAAFRRTTPWHTLENRQSWEMLCHLLALRWTS